MRLDRLNSERRLVTVDAWRFIAIVAVIAIHTIPDGVADPSIRANWREPSFLLTQLARFAVPYFFIVSGYFWALRAGRSDHPIRESLPAIRRIATIFVIWSFVYALPHDVVSIIDGGPLQPLRVAWWHLSHQLESPLTLLTQGTKSPLWFLVGLLCAMVISAWFVQRGWYNTLFAAAAVLYVVQLLAKPYRETAIGLAIDFNTRNGPFVGTLFFATGLLLSRRTRSSSWAIGGLALFVVGAALHLVENWFVAMHFGVTTSPDFVVGTYPMGVGIGLIALSGWRMPGAERLAVFGKYALGIYVVHSLFVELISSLGARLARSPPPFLLTQGGSIVVVLLCSLGTVRLLMRSRTTRLMVL